MTLQLASNLLYSFGVSIEYIFFVLFATKYLSSVFMWNKSRGMNFCSTIISQTFKSTIIKGPFENTTNFFFRSKLPKTSRNAKKFSDIFKSFTICCRAEIQALGK